MIDSPKPNEAVLIGDAEGHVLPPLLQGRELPLRGVVVGPVDGKTDLFTVRIDGEKDFPNYQLHRSQLFAGDALLKVMSPAEFRSLGFLQEINRLFLHPRGLALEVVTEDCPQCLGHGRRAPRNAEEVGKTPSCTACGGSGEQEGLGRIWDYREDPEGIAFAGEPGSVMSQEKADVVEAEFQKHAMARVDLLGAQIQPIGGELGPEEES